MGRLTWKYIYRSIPGTSFPKLCSRVAAPWSLLDGLLGSEEQRWGPVEDEA